MCERLGLEVETLEEPLYVNPSLRTRVSGDLICRGYELEIFEILVIVELRVMDILEFDVIRRRDWLPIESSLIVIVGGLLPTHRMVLCYVSGGVDFGIELHPGTSPFL